MTENEQTSDEKLSALTTEYLIHINYSNRRDEFNNCSIYRILLYSLRKRLLKFIEENIKEFIFQHGLSDSNKSNIIDKIKDKVRRPTETSDEQLSIEETTNPASLDTSLVNKAKNRIRLIEKLKQKANENRITATDWRTIAKCYTGSFQMNKNEQFDPKDLLEILMFCSLFSDKLYPAALKVVRDRNEFYGHISVLVIESDTLRTLKSAIDSLLEHIPA